MTQPTDRRFWAPQALAAREARLAIRARILSATRRWFDAAGFTEVETPALQLSPGMEPHLGVFETRLLPPGAHALDAAEAGARRYLHTSPEFAMKKLLAGGRDLAAFRRIWQLAPVFRNAEGSGRHSPEFRMLEWYRAEAAYLDLIDDCRGLLSAAAEVAGTPLFRAGDRVCDVSARWERISVAEAFERWVGLDLPALTQGDPSDPDAAPMIEAARGLGLRAADDDRWEDAFFRILEARVEPHLGADRPTALHSYPISMAALSRPSADDPATAERFELYVAGVELANAFGELADAGVQRARFEADRALHERLYGRPAPPIDEGFLEAVETLPPRAAGIALGFDRLVMLATGADDIREVQWAWVE
ncbi:MAG: EF-P lysine aminoacylase EpmA [Marivibrio sp.]|uniref:EF-P lysine aminoacylase EpmA n=1 Tax=Marivibrio sp. TaxID=2039719 RepID=UPI0032EBA079